MASEYDAVLDGGDFDIKSPTRNSHSLVREVIDIHNVTPYRICLRGKPRCLWGLHLSTPDRWVWSFRVVSPSDCMMNTRSLLKDGLKVRVVGILSWGSI